MDDLRGIGPSKRYIYRSLVLSVFFLFVQFLRLSNVVHGKYSTRAYLHGLGWLCYTRPEEGYSNRYQQVAIGSMHVTTS